MKKFVSLVSVTVILLCMILQTCIVSAATQTFNFLPEDEESLEMFDIKVNQETDEAYYSTEITPSGSFVVKRNSSWEATGKDYSSEDNIYFDATKPVILKYDFTVTKSESSDQPFFVDIFFNVDGVDTKITFTKDNKFALKPDDNPDTNPVNITGDVKGSIDLRTIPELIDSDDEIVVKMMHIYAPLYGRGDKIEFRTLKIEDKADDEGGSSTQAPTAKPGNTDKAPESNNQTSDAAMLLPLVLAAASIFGGMKLKKK